MRKKIGYFLSVMLIFAALVSLSVVHGAAGITDSETGLIYTVSGDTATVTGYDGAVRDLTIPTALGGYPVRAIGDNAFAGRTDLREIILPEGLTTIGQNAFGSCTALSHIVMPGSVTGLGHYQAAFDGCTAITSVGPMGSGAQYQFGWTDTIPAGAFRGLPNLTEVDLPEGIRTIEGSMVSNGAFQDCRSLTFVAIPSTTETLGRDAFKGCTALEEVDFVGVSRLVTIDDNVFAGCTSLTEILLPEGLKDIGQYAFGGCTALRHIVMPGTVTGLGYYQSAFTGCTAITSAGPKGSGADYEFGWIETIPAGAFRELVNLTEIDLPEGIQTIEGSMAGFGALQDCTSLTEILLPDSVETLGKSAFKGCTALERVTIPEGSRLVTIGDNVFERCSALTEILLPEGLKNIGQYAFGGCTALRHIVMPGTVTDVGYYQAAFDGCTAITSAGPIGSGCDYEFGWIETIPAGAFRALPNLTKVDLPEGLHTIEGSMAGFGVFQDCTGLLGVNLPSTLKTIGRNAFCNCDGLESITLPYGLTTIEKGAFAACEGLQNIYFNGMRCEIDPAAFDAVAVLHIYPQSEIMETVIQRGWLYQLRSESGTLSYLLADPDRITLRTTGNLAYMGNRLPIILQYGLEEDVFAQVSNARVMFRLSSDLAVNYNQVYMDGQKLALDRFTYDETQNTLILPLEKASGKLQVYAKPVGAQARTTVGAYLLFEKDGAEYNEYLDILSLSLPVLSLEAPQESGDRFVQVSGVATADADIVIKVGKEVAAEVTARKDGYYWAEIELPNAAGSYTVTACMAEDASVKSTATVKYIPGAPVLREFVFEYPVHGGYRKMDLMDPNGSRVYAILPNVPVRFRIRYENPENIGNLYVTSTKNGITDSMRAMPTDKRGEYYAEGFFREDDHGYIPETLNIVYFDKREEMPEDMKFTNEKITVDTYEDAAGGEITIHTDFKNGLTMDIEALEKAEAAAVYRRLFGKEPPAGVDLMGEIRKELESDSDAIVMEIEDSIISYNSKNRRIVMVQQPQKQRSLNDEINMMISEIRGEMTRQAMDMNKDPLVKRMFSLLDSKIAETYSTASDGAGFFSDIYNADRWFKNSGEKYKEMQENKIGYDSQQALNDMAWSENQLSTGGQSFYGFMVNRLQEYGRQLEDLLKDAFSKDEDPGEDGHKETAKKTRGSVDPSGTVYSASTGLPLGGVTATAYWIENVNEDPNFFDTVPADDVYGVLWDAGEFGQENPLITDRSGTYAWMVPEGWWRVKYEKTGYETTWSEWMNVPPERTEVNVWLVGEEPDPFRIHAEEETAGKIAVEVTNTATGEYTKARYMLAAYDRGGRMLGADIGESLLRTENTVQLTLEIDPSVVWDHYKVFVLDGQNVPLQAPWTPEN